MEALRWNEIYGNWATVLLPINEDDSIDYSRLEDEIDYLIDAKVNGIYTNGTAGEFYNISEHEFDSISTILAEKCEKTETAFQIGASHMSPLISLERIKRAAKYKPGAIQVILSDWVPLSDLECIDCLKRMEDAADGIGLVLYNPPHAKRVLEPDMYAKIKELVPSLVGVKTAGGDEQWYIKMKEYAKDISIFIPGHRLATGICKGAHGSYSNIAALQPAGAQKWYEKMNEDMDLALDIEKRILKFILEYIIPYAEKSNYSNQAIDKLLAAIGGWSNVGTRLRWPYRGLEGSEISKFIPIVRELIPELFGWQV